MKTMKDYYDLYLKCDVLLLAGVVEKIRNNSLKNYGLCRSHWDAILKITKTELEFIPDPDMYIFIKKGTRGGISYISNRYSKTNKCYDPKEESKHIIYLDANNLYGNAMSKFLPRSGFKWIVTKEFDLNKYTSNS